ncbi:transposase [Pseudomonas monteilii]|uniref:transposase n=1 Tax=Pseudomonas monteilii TaxID=76759 RepID=UPI0022870FD5|nr:transposase [Pseudomonas monteilii]
MRNWRVLVAFTLDWPLSILFSKIARLPWFFQGWFSGELIACYFPELMQPAWRGNALWSASYFAGSVGGAPLEGVRRYIEQQDRPA